MGTYIWRIGGHGWVVGFCSVRLLVVILGEKIGSILWTICILYITYIHKMMKMTFSAKYTPVQSQPVSVVTPLTNTVPVYPILSMQNDMFGRLQNAKPCGSCGGTR